MNEFIKQFFKEFLVVGSIFLALKLILAMNMGDEPFVASIFFEKNWPFLLGFPAALALIRVISKAKKQ